MRKLTFRVLSWVLVTTVLFLQLAIFVLTFWVMSLLLLLLPVWVIEVCYLLLLLRVMVTVVLYRLTFWMIEVVVLFLQLAIWVFTRTLLFVPVMICMKQVLKCVEEVVGLIRQPIFWTAHSTSWSYALSTPGRRPTNGWSMNSRTCWTGT